MTCSTCGAWTNGRSLCERHAPELHAACQQEIAALKAELAFEKDCTVLARVMDERDSLKAECERMRGRLEVAERVYGVTAALEKHDQKAALRKIVAAIAPAQKPIEQARCGKPVNTFRPNTRIFVGEFCPKPPNHLEPCAPGKGSE